MPKGSVVARKCRQCDKEFETSDSRKLVCSGQCNWRWQNTHRQTTQLLDRPCVTCGKSFKPEQARGVGRAWCSVQCRRENRRTKQAEYREGPYKAMGGNQRFNLRRYGLTIEEYEAMLAAQSGRCAICDKQEAVENRRGSGRRRMLSVDHCHTKGHVRKLLCVKCNVGLGNFLDDPALLRKAATYLEV